MQCATIRCRRRVGRAWTPAHFGQIEIAGAAKNLLIQFFISRVATAALAQAGLYVEKRVGTPCRSEHNAVVASLPVYAHPSAMQYRNQAALSGRALQFGQTGMLREDNLSNDVRDEDLQAPRQNFGYDLDAHLGTVPIGITRRSF